MKRRGVSWSYRDVEEWMVVGNLCHMEHTAPSHSKDMWFSEIALLVPLDAHRVWSSAEFVKTVG